MLLLRPLRSEAAGPTAAAHWHNSLTSPALCAAWGDCLWPPRRHVFRGAPARHALCQSQASPSLRAAHVPAPALNLQASFPSPPALELALGTQTYPQPGHPIFKSSLPPEGTGAPFSPMTAPKIQRWGCFEWATHTWAHTPRRVVHAYIHSTTHPCTRDSNHHVLRSRDNSSCSCLFILFQGCFSYRIGKSPSVCNTLCWRLHGKQALPTEPSCRESPPEHPLPRGACQCRQNGPCFCPATQPSHCWILPDRPTCPHTLRRLGQGPTLHCSDSKGTGAAQRVHPSFSATSLYDLFFKK